MTYRVLLDVDGPCAQFVPHLLTLLGSSVKPDDIVEWDMFKFLPEEEVKEAKRILAEQEFWLTVPVVDGAVEKYESIVSAGHQVFFVTSPWDSCVGWGKARKAWLKNTFGIDPRESVVITDAKFICTGDVFIDDKPSHIKAWSDWHPHKAALMYELPHNRNLPGDKFSWDRLPSYLGG